MDFEKIVGFFRRPLSTNRGPSMVDARTRAVLKSMPATRKSISSKAYRSSSFWAAVLSFTVFLPGFHGYRPTIGLQPGLPMSGRVREARPF